MREEGNNQLRMLSVCIGLDRCYEESKMKIEGKNQNESIVLALKNL